MEKPEKSKWLVLLSGVSWGFQRCILFLARVIAVLAGLALVPLSLHALLTHVNSFGAALQSVTLLVFGFALLAMGIFRVKNSRQIHAEQKEKVLEAAQYGGDTKAQRDLAAKHYHGEDGYSQNFAQSAAWMREAAHRGDPQARLYLGTMHLEGRGVPQSDARALEYYRKAAEAGDGVACHMVGCFYNDGRVVDRNITEAHRWYKKAADKGVGDSLYFMGMDYFYGDNDIPKDIKKGLQYLRQAADMLHAASAFLLAIHYLAGVDEEYGWFDAMPLLRMAGDDGHLEARCSYLFYTINPDYIARNGGYDARYESIKETMGLDGRAVWWFCKLSADRAVRRAQKRRVTA